MSDRESTEIKVQINSIGAVYRQLAVSFMIPNPPIPKMPEMEPSYVSLGFTPLAEEISHNGASVIIKKEDVKRLNLMVGDTVVLRITKS